ncbi:MAG: hypothetical protein ACI9WS_002847 [Paraglaciecola psychrophila]
MLIWLAGLIATLNIMRSDRPSPSGCITRRFLIVLTSVTGRRKGVAIIFDDSQRVNENLETFSDHHSVVAGCLYRVAEGVETLEQRAFLHHNGLVCVQAFYLVSRCRALN